MSTTRASHQLVAAICTGSSQVRVFVSTWRGETKIELKPYSETIPGVPMPCGPGVSLPIHKLRELLTALHRIGGAP